MALVLDNRNNGNAGPGVHALIVGVSSYPNLPDQDEPSGDATWSLNKLSSPALSALSIFEFIRANDLQLPLKTVRLLLSPSELELGLKPELAAATTSRATRENFEAAAAEWRNDASQNREDMTLFYFAGHGTQRGPEDAVLMLEDFLTGAASLGRCFEIHNLKGGMAPSPTFPNIALTQFYFIDACMDRNAKLKTLVNPSVPPVFDVELNVVDRRAAPLFYSTVDGAIALGRKGKTSHFCEALTAAFHRGAEEPDETDRWPVTALTIKNALDFYYIKNKLGTMVTMGSLVGSPVVRYLPGPPTIDVSVEIQPDPLAPPPFTIDVLDDQDDAIVAGQLPAAGTKFTLAVPAGAYRLQIKSDRLLASPYRSKLRLSMKPTLKPWTHDIGSLLRP